MTHEQLAKDFRTIIHISDLHLEPRDTEQYPGLHDRLTRIQSVVKAIDADLLVATGDLTNRGSSTPSHFELARTWLDALKTPYLALPGNHDLGANRLRGQLFPDLEHYEECKFQATGYAAAFGANPVSRIFLGDVTVLGVALREDDPDGTVDALAQELLRTAGPVVVAGHYPVVPTRGLVNQEPFGAFGYVDRAAERLHQLLRAHDHVIAYLCGHVHLTSMRMVGRHCAQFTAGGIGPGAAALRIYEWNGRSWNYSTMDLEGPDNFWEGGLPEAHSNPEFSSGSPAEREGVWVPPWMETHSLSQGKQLILGQPS